MLWNTSWMRLRSILLNIGKNNAPRSAYSPRCFLKYGVLLDVGLECRRLLRRREHASVRVGERHEVHLRRVARDVDQVVSGEAVAVHVAREHIAQVRGGALSIRERRLRLPEGRNRRRAEAEVRAGVRRGHEQPVSLRVARESQARVVRDRPRAGCWQTWRTPSSRGRSCSWIRRSCRPPGSTSRGTSVFVRLPDMFHDEPTLWFFITNAFVMTFASGVVDPVGRPARAVVDAGECRLRRGQIRVDVVDAVDVLVIEELDRARDAAGQTMIDAEVRAPDLRKLEVRIGDVQLEARRAFASDVRRLVPIGCPG